MNEQTNIINTGDDDEVNQSLINQEASESTKQSTKSSIDILINSTTTDQHISQISKLVLNGKNNEALLLIQVVLEKDNLSDEEISKIYLHKGNIELGLNEIDNAIESYTEARKRGSHYLSLVLSNFYLQYDGEKLTKEEAFLEAQKELKLAIENNIVEAYSILGDLYNNNGDSKSADQLYLSGIELGDIDSAKKFIAISKVEIDKNNQKEVNEFYKLFNYLIDDKGFEDLIGDLGDFNLEVGDTVKAFNNYQKHYTSTGNISFLKKQSEVLEQNYKDFNFLKDKQESQKDLYKNIIVQSNLKKDNIHKAYGLEKLADMQLVEGNKASAINNYKSIYFLGKDIRDLKIIEQGAYKLLQVLDSKDELIAEIQGILILNNRNHLLTVGNYYEERNNYHAALENYMIANEYEVNGANDCIVFLINMYYMKDSTKNHQIDDLIQKLDNNEKLNDEDVSFLRLYINFN